VESAARVEAAITTRGAAKVLAELHAQPERWRSVYRGIASGDRAWLKVGQDLAAAADAGWSYDIDLAFGEALVVAPGLVLKMAPDLGATCGNIDDPFTDNVEKALAEVRKRELSVLEVKKPELAKEQTACLKGLGDLRDALPKAYGTTAPLEAASVPGRESFQTALRAAEANLRTEAGLAYDRTLSAYFPQHYGAAMDDCVKAEKTGDLAAFTLAFKLVEDGHVESALVRPESKIATCLRDKVKQGQLPKPPRSGYWVRVEMKFGP